MENSKKRIAICFWGQTRTFRTLEEVYNKLYDEEVEIDYFVSTWDDFDNKEPFNNFTKKEFLNSDNYDLKNNTEKAFYLINRVNKLKSDYEIENKFVYDYILWTRNGILFDPNTLMPFLKEKATNHKDLEIITHSDIRYEQGVLRLDADYYFSGTSVAFDLYACGWKYYFKGKNSSSFQGINGGHHAHAFIIKAFNFQHSTFNLHHEFLFNKLKKREVC